MSDIKDYFRLISYWNQLSAHSSPSGSFHIGEDFLLSLHTDSGILFEAFDPEFNKLFDFTIEDMVARWESR